MGQNGNYNTLMRALFGVNERGLRPELFRLNSDQGVVGRLNLIDKNDMVVAALGRQGDEWVINGHGERPCSRALPGQWASTDLREYAREMGVEVRGTPSTDLSNVLRRAQIERFSPVRIQQVHYMGNTAELLMDRGARIVSIDNQNPINYYFLAPQPPPLEGLTFRPMR